MVRSMRCGWPAGIGAVILLAASSAVGWAGPGEDAAAKVLIATGEDHPAHKWQATTPVLREQLGKDDRLAVRVSDDLVSLRSEPLDECDVVVMHFKNYDPNKPGRQWHDSLAQFVRDGGGLVLVHFACGAFQELKGEFVKLAGRVWNPELRAHDPYGEFRVEITAAEHPITHGLAAFDTTDELYTCLAGETPITVLAEAQSRVDGKRYPMAFVLRYGKGRVFHCVLGHDAKALGVAEVGELFRRGTAWAAGLTPTASTGGGAGP